MSIQRNPKDSMKSTWRTDKTRKSWGPIHYLLEFLDVYHDHLDKPVPVFAKTDPVPYLSGWSCHIYVLVHAMYPMAIHRALIWYLGRELPGLAVFALYTLCMQANSIHEVKILRRIGYQTGYFDGDLHPRDQVPDVGVEKAFNSLQMTLIIRPMLATFLAYNSKTAGRPSISWWLPVELGLYAIILDFFFYIYHRTCHELDALWKYHRTHHLTKHPNPLLSSYADSEQEFLEIALIPVLTWATLKLCGFPMGFYDWWICHQYIIFTEAFGHSGLRLYSTSTGTADWFLRLTGTELTVEDHDLHHRKGWRGSYNYGKQTRLWDKMFGTCHPRYEGGQENVDWNRPVHMPLF